MYTYSEIEYQLKLDLNSITERNNISEKDPLTHARLIKLLPAWLPIYKKMLNTREIVGIEFSAADHGKDVIYIYPILAKGCSDPYFDIRRTMYLKTEIDLKEEWIDFPHKHQWTGSLFKKLDDIDPKSETAIEDVKNLSLLIINSLENPALVNAPISSDDLIIRKQNQVKYRELIIKASNEGYGVFNTLPLQSIFDQICQYHGNNYDTGYNRKILLDFVFFTVMEKCKTLLESADWRYSVGAPFIHQKAIDLNMKIVPFDLGHEVLSVSLPYLLDVPVI
ncbi:MAG TPA: hypothetical protein PK950_01985 [Candidatus Paceibacterota bacterium]|nr:hypothetical protein [Candidatus Paceibacterota bacterium]